MIFYYSFENNRYHSEMYRAKGASAITVQLIDDQLLKHFPSDLVYDVKNGNIVTYIIEDITNKRLTLLQKTIAKHLQEIVNTSV